jgi:hypothetical protein
MQTVLTANGQGRPMYWFLMYKSKKALNLNTTWCTGTDFYCTRRLTERSKESQRSKEIESKTTRDKHKQQF